MFVALNLKINQLSEGSIKLYCVWEKSRDKSSFRQEEEKPVVNARLVNAKKPHNWRAISRIRRAFFILAPLTTFFVF
jgi:hypothetical protein